MEKGCWRNFSMKSFPRFVSYVAV
ncbi:hypothetical protein LINPERHAP1_LOCUS11444 [Linum perenne]